MSHLIRQVGQQPSQPIACGLMRKLIGADDFSVLDMVHVTIIDRTRRHYHQTLTEFYYVLSGSIRVELDGTTEELTSGSLLVIHPNTPHQAVKTSKENAEILVVCSPAWRADDEIYSD